jgi:hypothetical protein
MARLSGFSQPENPNLVAFTAASCPAVSDLKALAALVQTVGLLLNYLFSITADLTLLREIFVNREAFHDRGKG